MHHSILIIPVLALLAGAVSAWLPQDRNLAAFNLPSLGKRAEKIRGVNFGGMSPSRSPMPSCHQQQLLLTFQNVSVYICRYIILPLYFKIRLDFELCAF
jgi:hypothetical protein